MEKQKTRFRIGGIQECMFLAVILSVCYIFLCGFTDFKLPMFHNDVGDVFGTLVLGVIILFPSLSIIEIFWFERNLSWSGRKKKEDISHPNPKGMGIRNVKLI